MDNFSVNISVNDCLCCKCNTCNKMVTEILTSTEQFIPLQCGYYLKLITVTNDYVVISIDNEFLYIVRKLYIDVPIRVCIPNNCYKHTLTITLNSITAS